MFDKVMIILILHHFLINTTIVNAMNNFGLCPLSLTLCLMCMAVHLSLYPAVKAFVSLNSGLIVKMCLIYSIPKWLGRLQISNWYLFHFEYICSYICLYWIYLYGCKMYITMLDNSLYLRVYVQSAHDISNTDTSKYGLISKYDFDTFPFFISTPFNSNNWYLKINFMQPRKFNLRYQWLKVSFHFEMSRVHCIFDTEMIFLLLWLLWFRG